MAFRLCQLLIAFILIASASAQAQFFPDPYPELAKGGKGGWLNVERPLTVDDFKGKAVLLDFWTYGCINCMQIIPDLEYLEGKFGNKLLIVGVHSAKFSGESGNERILFAAKRFGLKHPVINDADFAIWNSYGVKAWPTQVLLDANGKEVARYSGEGHRAEIEKDIAKLDIQSMGASAPVLKSDTKSALSFPARIKVSGDKIVIADAGHNQIVIADLQGKIITRIGSGEKSFKSGDFSTASFNAPRGFAASKDRIYVADTGNHALREINLTTKIVKTLAGDGIRGEVGHLASPWDVAMLDDHTLMIANAGTHQILSYDLTAEKFSTLAGNSDENIKDGSALDAALAQTSALSISDGVIYFLDPESSALRMLKDGQVKTLIGTGLFDFGLKDGKYPEARLQHSQGLSVDGDKIYIADTYNNKIRVYDLKSEVLSTLPIKGADLSEPGDIFVRGDKGWITNTDKNEINQIDLKTGKVSTIISP